MTAARYDLVIDQGSDFALEFTVSESGTVKNLTGYSARAQIRPTKASETLTATFTCTIPVGTDGKINMDLSNSITDAVVAGLYQYDLEIFTLEDTSVQKLLHGEVTIKQGVTR